MVEFLENYRKQPDELTPDEVAKILRCTKQMVYKLILSDDCELIYYRIGTRYWITKSSLRDYLMNHRGGCYHE